MRRPPPRPEREGRSTDLKASDSWVGADAPRILLVCSGLDHARRGFESFARECFEALAGEPSIRIELVKGSGAFGPRERSVPTLRRDRPAARALARALGARPLRVEAAAFAASLQPVILRRHPDVVYLSEWDTARGLAALRALTRQSYKLLLCNGGFAATGFEHLDHVQELTPAAREYVIERGADPERHTMLPLGFNISSRLVPTTDQERAARRDRLALPRDRAVVISVAALNLRHKRLDYLIEELSQLPEPRPFLLLVGEPEAETAIVRRLARERLGEAGHDIRTVAAAAIPDLLRASDALVLASLVEAQARALVEGLSAGIPCLAHDTAVTRFAAGDHALLGDFTRTGSLARLLRAQRDEAPERTRERILRGHTHVYERFSWDRLRPRYAEMLASVARPTASPAFCGAANSTVSSCTGDAVRR